MSKVWVFSISCCFLLCHTLYPLPHKTIHLSEDISIFPYLKFKHTIRIRGGQSVSNFSYLAEAKDPSHFKKDWLDSAIETYDTWTPEEIRLRKNQISSQPWFDFDVNRTANITEDVDNQAMASCQEEARLQKEFETGLVKDEGNIFGGDMPKECEDEGDDEMDWTEYASEDVCEAMRKESTAKMTAENTSNEKQLSLAGNNSEQIEIEYVESGRNLENPEETIQMVSILSNGTLALVNYNTIQHGEELYCVSTLADLINAIQKEVVVVPSLPVAIVHFLSINSNCFVKDNAAVGKRFLNIFQQVLIDADVELQNWTRLVGESFTCQQRNCFVITWTGRGQPATRHVGNQGDDASGRSGYGSGLHWGRPGSSLGSTRTTGDETLAIPGRDFHIIHGFSLSLR